MPHFPTRSPHPLDKPARPSPPIWAAEAVLWLIAAAIVSATATVAPGLHRSGRAVDLLLLATIGAWGADLVAGRARPSVPWPLAAAAGWLVLQGWWMAGNAASAYQPAGMTLRPVEACFPWAPGSVDGAESARAAVRASLLLGVACATCHLAATSPRHAGRLLVAVAAVGAGTAVVGAVGRFCRLPLVADAMLPREGTPFATFNYHANAGAFMNVCLPAALVLAPGAAAATDGRGSAARSWAAVMSMVIAACGAALNVSKASLPLTAGTLAAVVKMGFLARAGPTTTTTTTTTTTAMAAAPSRRWGRRPVAGWTLLALGVAVAGAVAVRAGGQWQRWDAYLRDPNAMAGRTLLWRVVLDLVADAGPWGHGPGTYKLLFPPAVRHRPQLYSKFIVTPHVPGGPVSMWSQAHQDYLQAVAEWGWVGAAGGGVIVFGALARAVAYLVRRRGRAERAGGGGEPGEPRRACVAAAAIALTGVLVHAAMDFPLQVLPIQVVTAVYVGIAWGLTRGNDQSRDREGTTESA